MNHSDLLVRSTAALEVLLTDARRSVEVEPEELDEARHRRDLIAAALLEEFPGSTIYVNGSVAHGDALTPLTDVDLGVIVADAPGYGPTGKGPLDLMERVRDAIRPRLGAEFPKLTVTVEGQHRAVLVRFGDPVTKGQPDFTADVIVALDNPKDAGLFIPNLPEGWDRSDPQQHTTIVLAANEATHVAYAHIVRLLKAWNRRHGKPLCSWNIKALALGCIREPISQTAGMLAWFTYAIRELTRELTPDPAHVAPDPIELCLTKPEVLGKLGRAKDQLTKAIDFEAQGLPLNAQRELSKLLPDLVPAVNNQAADEELADSLRSTVTIPAQVAPTAFAAAVTAPRKASRSWAP